MPKKVIKSKKKAANKNTAKSTFGIEHDFIIIAGGGFIVIILILMLLSGS